MCSLRKAFGLGGEGFACWKGETHGGPTEKPKSPSLCHCDSCGWRRFQVIAAGG